MIKVQGIDTYPTTGRLDMTIVAITPADARLSLPQALLAYWLPHRDALPRDAVYAPGKSAEQVENEDADMMETAQDDAVVAALRADERQVTEMPAIFSVTVGGPRTSCCFRVIWWCRSTALLLPTTKPYVRGSSPTRWGRR